MRGIYQNIHPARKIAVTAFISLLGLFIFMILSLILSIPIFGMDVFSQMVNSSITANPENIQVLKYFQLTQSLGLFVAPSIFLALLFGQSISQYLYLHKKPLFWGILLATLIVLFSSPIINLLAQWNEQMSLPQWMQGIEQWMRNSEDTAAELTELFVQTSTIGGLFYNIFLIALIPAIGEELLFRGIIQRVFTEWFKNEHIAIWLTAIIFSALHLQFFGFIPRVFLGALFGYLLIYSRNLWLPVIAHFVNNAAAVVAYYLFNNNYIATNPDKLGVEGKEASILAIASTILIVFLFVIFYKNRKSITRQAA
jgi:hypothetical protein